MIKSFNDLFAIILIILIIALWILSGLHFINLSGEILGATIAVFTLIAQFYYRKAKGGS